MKTVNIYYPWEEIKCPRCNEVIKREGILISSSDISKYYFHVGSLRCRLQEKYQRLLNDKEFKKLYYKEIMEDLNKREDRPLCMCGCGEKVNWNTRYNRWSKFVKGHYIYDKITIKKYLKDALNIGIQSELYKKKKFNSQKASRIARKLEKLGLVKREKILYNGKWTYKIVKALKFKKDE
jgi:hypothetical protein